MSTSPIQGLPPSSELRLMTKVAWMYHQENRKQDEIADQLHLSQSRVSRLLKAAVQEGIVVTTVKPPPGMFTELEARVATGFGLEECVVVQSRDTEAAITHDIGIAAADYLSTTLLSQEIVGISSWSETWLAAANQMRSLRSPVARQVVQLVGGLGNPMVQTQATLLLARLARVMGATPVFMQTPGVMGDDRALELLMNDPAVKPVTQLWDQLTVALLGVGSIEPSPLLRESGNIFPAEVISEIQALGGIGDICHRYFDATGTVVKADIDRRLAGITPEQLLRVPRRVGAAGGPRKAAALLGALRGGWLTTLITDSRTADFLAAAVGVAPDRPGQPVFESASSRPQAASV